jgi:biotin carboxyl carrier protein
MSSKPREYSVAVEGRDLIVAVDGAAGRAAVSIDGGLTRECDLHVHGGLSQYSLLMDKRSYEGIVEQTDDGLRVWVAGEPFDLQVIDRRLKSLAGGRAVAGRAQKATMSTPMPGMVVAVSVAAGDHVKKGQPILTLEAMKMRNDLKSPRDGKIKDVKVATGQTVAKGDVLVEFEA